MSSNTVELRTLITEEYFKQYSPIPANYDIRELKPYFHVAEAMWILPIIGAPLYDELLDQVEEDNVTPENATLLLNIYPLLSFAIVSEGLPLISYHMSQVGITKGKSENSDSVSINDVNYISRTLRSQCEVMKKLLKEFLDAHSDLYPLYYSDNNIQCDCDGEGWDWITAYYTDGIYDKYQWQRNIAEFRMRRFNPNSYNQVYSPRRLNTSLR